MAAYFRSSSLRPITVLLMAGLLHGLEASSSVTEFIEPEGLDQILEILDQDERLNQKVTPEAIAEAKESIIQMNALIKEAVVNNGLANDGVISIADVREVNRYLSTYYQDRWRELRGVDADDDSTGYYQVQKNGARTLVMNQNAVRTLWAGIYDLGFPVYDEKANQLSSAAGEKSQSLTTVGYNLGEVLRNDISDGSWSNATYQEVSGSTGTGLDVIITVIISDSGLLRKVPTGDLRTAATSADSMNQLILEAIREEGLANDREISAADARNINAYLVANYQTRWAVLHGDDEDGEETGYHLAQNDGAYERMFADNVINSVADGIYHLGFYTDQQYVLLNEDGNKNKSFEKVAWWLDTILEEDMNSGVLDNSDYQEVIGSTGTTFDQIVPFIYQDEGLKRKVSMEDIRVGASAADGMNVLIVEAIRATGVAEDGSISKEDVGALNQYLVANYATEWAALHGDDEEDEETGYHRIQNDGALGYAYNRNIINSLADSVYHLGFYTPYENRLANEDGNKNASFSTVAYWLNKALAEDFAQGVF